MCGNSTLPSITENNNVYQNLIRRRRDQGFKIYKLKGNIGFKIYKLKENLSWLRVLQTVCNLFFSIIIILLSEMSLNSMIWNICMLISVLNLNKKFRNPTKSKMSDS